jgi:hypothetical protein
VNSFPQFIFKIFSLSYKHKNIFFVLYFTTASIVLDSLVFILLGVIGIFLDIYSGISSFRNIFSPYFFKYFFFPFSFSPLGTPFTVCTYARYCPVGLWGFVNFSLVFFVSLLHIVLYLLTVLKVTRSFFCDLQFVVGPI